MLQGVQRRDGGDEGGTHHFKTRLRRARVWAGVRSTRWAWNRCTQTLGNVLRVHRVSKNNPLCIAILDVPYTVVSLFRKYTAERAGNLFVVWIRRCVCFCLSVFRLSVRLLKGCRRILLKFFRRQGMAQGTTISISTAMDPNPDSRLFIRLYFCCDSCIYSQERSTVLGGGLYQNGPKAKRPRPKPKNFSHVQNGPELWPKRPTVELEVFLAPRVHYVSRVHWVRFREW